LQSAAEQPPEDAVIAAAAAARPVAPPKEDSDTEPDEDAELRGDGWVGHGEPFQVGAADKARDFVEADSVRLGGGRLIGADFLLAAPWRAWPARS